MLVAGAAAVFLFAGCGASQLPGVPPSGKQLRRALEARSGFPAAAPHRPLVLAGRISLIPAGFPHHAAKARYLERSVRLPARLRRPTAADGPSPASFWLTWKAIADRIED